MTTITRIATIAATAALLAAPFAASAQNTLGRKGAPATRAAAPDLITADQVDAIARVARGMGTAEVSTTDDGEPVIEAAVDGVNYFIWFYGCQDSRGTGCTSIQLSAAFSADDVPSDTLNAWNRDFRYGSGYVLDDGTLVIQWSINLDGGVTPTNFEDTMGLWQDTLEVFIEHFTS